MDLEKLQQETESLQQIDVTKLSPEQLQQLVDKLSNILEQSEQSLLQTSLNEIKEIENESND
jgi:hypothetical protein